MKVSEAVREVIRLGDASHAYWDRELRKHHPHYPIIRAGEDSGPPPPEDAQTQTLLQSLPEDQLYVLLVLTYVGRGDFSADQLLPAYHHLKEIFPSKNLAIAEMMEQSTLAEYLTDALEELQKRRVDLDRFSFASTLAAS